MKRSYLKESDVQLKVVVPSAFHYRLKIEALRRRQTMTELVVEAVTAHLAKPRRTNGHAQEPA